MQHPCSWVHHRPAPLHPLLVVQKVLAPFGPGDACTAPGLHTDGAGAAGRGQPLIVGQQTRAGGVRVAGGDYHLTGE